MTDPRGCDLLTACGPRSKLIGLGLKADVLHDTRVLPLNAGDPAAALLYHVDEFVTDEVIACGRAGVILAAREVHIIPLGECQRPHPLGGLSRVHAHVREIRAQRLLHFLPGRLG
jgi:hypothetical protein